MCVNSFRRSVETGGRPIQAFLNSGSTFITRLIADVGFDSLLFDMQQGPTGIDRLYDLVMVAGAHACPMVRVPSAEIGILEKAVDAGVCGVVCPSVDDADQCARVVTACEASRYGDVMSIVQIETVAGFDNLELILATPGLDGVLPGPSDLSVAFGGPRGFNYTDDTAAARLRRIIETAHRLGVKVGLPAFDGTQIDIIDQWGIDWIALLGETVWIRNSATGALTQARAALANGA